MKRQLLSLLLALVLLCAMAVPVSARDVPKFDELGSITVSMKYDGKAVPGGELALYKVGDVVEDDGNYSFTPTENFADSNPDFTVITANQAQELADLAQKLADYAKSKGMNGVATETAADDGIVKFTDIPIGLYLVVQTKTASNYDPIKPFLVSLPYYMEETDTYDYSVDATSKMSRLTYNPPPPPPPSTPSGNLPQTGQLNWPVPVLAVGGLVLFTVGWMLRSGRKKEENAE